MNFLYFLLLVPMCHSLAIDKSKVPLPAPNLWRFETIDDPVYNNSSEKITWTRVESGDDQDPVIGYKVKIWVIKKIKTTVYKNQGGELVAVEKEEYPRIAHNMIPDGVPTEVIIPANTTTMVYPVEVDVAYQFAVLAFTKTREGPLSSPTRIRLHPKEEEVKVTGSVGN